MSAFFDGKCPVCSGFCEHFDFCPLLPDVPTVSAIASATETGFPRPGPVVDGVTEREEGRR